MYEVPPEVVKTWPEPNYDNPETRGHGLIIVVSLFFLIAAFIVPVRCYTRWYITNSFGADDIFVMVAMIPTTGLAIEVLIANIHHGCDRHIWDTRPEKLSPCIKAGLTSSVLFAFASLLTKLSLYAFYLRLLTPEGSRLYKSIIWFLAVSSVVGALSFTFQICFLCRPVYAFWDYAPPLYRPPYEYHCADRFVINFYASLIYSLVDLVTMLVPIPIVWRLGLPLRQRLAVIGIFGLGTVVCVAGALKTKYVFDSQKYSYDEQWDGYPLWIIMTVEIDVGIICASAPALRPFIARYLPNVFNLSRGRSDDSFGKSPQPRQPKPFLFPHGSPPLRFPSDNSQDGELINDGDNYISLSSSLKSIPKANRHSRSSSLGSRRPNRQREEVPLVFKGEDAGPSCKHGVAFPSSVHPYQPNNQSSTINTTITGGAPLERETNSNLSTAKSRIGEELERQRIAVVRGVDRRTKPPDSDIEKGDSDSPRSWRTDYEEGHEDGFASQSDWR